MFGLKILKLGSGSSWELFATPERESECVCVYTNKVKKDLSKSKLECPSLHRNQIVQKYIKSLIYTLHVKLIDNWIHKLVYHWGCKKGLILKILRK